MTKPLSSKEYLKLLKRFSESPNDEKHIKDCHFPGLYSISLGRYNDKLIRAFIARPGELHPDLQNYNSWFLWHAHAYDFTEAVFAGSVINYMAIFKGYLPISPEWTQFNYFKFASGILDKFSIEHIGSFTFDVSPPVKYDAGQSFSMDAEDIHRVTFHPDTETGWFCSVLEETEKKQRPAWVYIPAKFGLDKPQYLDKLYENIEPEQAQRLVTELLQYNAAMRR